MDVGPAPNRLKRMQWLSLLHWALLLAFATVSLSALEWPGPPTGNAVATIQTNRLRLENQLLAFNWAIHGGKLQPAQVSALREGQSVALDGMELFQLRLSNGQWLKASDLTIAGAPEIHALTPRPDASILAHHFAGKQLVAHLRSADGNLQVEWRAILRDEANAIRQEFIFETKQTALAIQQIRLLDLPGAGALSSGTVPGSPLTIGQLFFAYEHPDTVNTNMNGHAICELRSAFLLRPGQPLLQSAAAGATPPGQLRRAFNYYVERERAHPYRPFLHYNAWYDICWDRRKITESECLNAVTLFERELINQRGVTLDSFVWDDGWDDPKTLWRPLQANFPNGFARILAAARHGQSTLGFWLSPFGGYGKPKDDRIAMGQAEGFETGPQGFSLAGPKYYTRFLETCSRFIQQDGANFFKFDGLARSVAETEAMLRLTQALRAQKPDLFISITTGTWPSPFWLWYGDSTWRGGNDMGFTGPGSKREQWITYRDRETYRNIVEAAPLYPLNSLMTQGFAHARYGTALEVGNDPDEIRRELRSFFASGTCLQELYVTPEKMSAGNWDDLAACAKWARTNADVLADTHWVGGDPGQNQPYGWASWTRRKGILALRNPAAEPRTLSVDIAQAFELPAGAASTFLLKSPWANAAEQGSLRMRAGQPHAFVLPPFEVVVYDASPD